MDTQLQEIDQALTALRRQLAQVRALARVLAVVVVALVAWIVVGVVHKPTSIVLEGRDGSLKLDSSEVALRVGPSQVTIGLDGIWIRHDGGDRNRTTHLEDGQLDMMAFPKGSTVSSSMASLQVLDGSARLMMLATPQSATLTVDRSRSELAVSAPHDKSVSIEATPKSAKVSGLGAALFGIGDGFSAPAQATP